jgi:hypothetical protein
VSYYLPPPSLVVAHGLPRRLSPNLDDAPRVVVPPRPSSRPADGSSRPRAYPRTRHRHRCRDQCRHRCGGWGRGRWAGTETRSGTMPAGGVASNARHRSKRRRGLVMIGLSTGLFVDGLRFTGLHVVEGISKIISLPFCICPSMLKFMVFL